MVLEELIEASLEVPVTEDEVNDLIEHLTNLDAEYAENERLNIIGLHAKLNDVYTL